MMYIYILVCVCVCVCIYIYLSESITTYIEKFEGYTLKKNSMGNRIRCMFYSFLHFII